MGSNPTPAASQSGRDHCELWGAETRGRPFGAPVGFDSPQGRIQGDCRLCGSCWRGCSEQAKNTLDLNYLAIVEDATNDEGKSLASIRTLTEATTIQLGEDGVFEVTATNHLGTGDDHDNPQTETVRGRAVFLCAGSLNTTEVLFSNKDTLFGGSPPNALGSRYYPNADSLSLFFDCDEVHEADYGPTITSALLYQGPKSDIGPYSVDFDQGKLDDEAGEIPEQGYLVKGEISGETAVLFHNPWLDWGKWSDGNAHGELVLSELDGQFIAAEELAFSDPEHPDNKCAKAVAKSEGRTSQDWFLAQDGGYSSDIEPMLGLFRSPLWMRRNRYIEDRPVPRSMLRPPRRDRLRLQTFGDAVGGTARRAVAPDGLIARVFDLRRFERDAMRFDDEKLAARN